jgi:hypothetical protein
MYTLSKTDVGGKYILRCPINKRIGDLKKIAPPTPNVIFECRVDGWDFVFKQYVAPDIYTANVSKRIILYIHGIEETKDNKSIYIPEELVDIVKSGIKALNYAFGLNPEPEDWEK